MHQTQRASAKPGPIAQWTMDMFLRLIPSAGETLPSASRGFSLKQNMCILLSNLVVIHWLPPGNVSPVEGITSGSSERHANRTRRASAAQPPVVKPRGEAKMHFPSRSITRRDPGPERSEGRKAPVFGQKDWLRTTNMDVCVSNGRYTGTRSMGGTRTGGRRIYWGLYGSTKRTEAPGIVRRGVL